MTNDEQLRISPSERVFREEDMDRNASPSDNFYRFANGGWLDANPVPDEYGAWGAAHELNSRNEDILHAILDSVAPDDSSRGDVSRLVGDYYASGMDTDRIEALGLEPIEPILGIIEAIDDPSELAPLLADLHRSGVGGFFDVASIPDFEDSTVNLLYVGQGGLGLPDRDYYLRDDETSLQLLSQYKKHIATMFTLLDADDAAASADTFAAASADTFAAASADTVLTIESAIAATSYTNVQMRDVELTTNRVDMSEAGTLMPSFGFDRYLSSVGAGEQSSFSIDNVTFYPAIDSLMSATPIADIKTYLVWNVLRGTATALPKRFSDEAFEFYGKTLGGQRAQKDRWKRVLAAASADIGQLVSQLYVVDNFPPEAKTRMESLVDNLLEAMESSIKALTWMSDETKVQALEKLAGFGYKIGYPDVWRDYTGLNLNRGTWLGNREAASRFEFARQMATLGEPVDPHDWSLPPHVVNAYYHPLRNEVVFPAGILQPPFFRLDADDAVNYGAIGSVIGHEITHGFDDQGSRFDADGNLRDWWTAEDRQEFDSRARVVVEQYNGYEVEDGLNVNGELTLGENIADLGGLKIAHGALRTALDGLDENREGLTHDQRFYLSFATIWRQNYTDAYLRLLVNADPHSPSDTRCNGPLSNLASFSRAFEIQDGSVAMRPVTERVDIW